MALPSLRRRRPQQFVFRLEFDPTPFVDTETLTRHAIERMDIPESDIKRIDRTSEGYVVVMKNHRRVPIDWPRRSVVT